MVNQENQRSQNRNSHSATTTTNMNPTTSLTKRIRSRAKHWFGLPITVRASGNTLTLGIRNPRSGGVIRENFDVDPNEVNTLDDDALSDYADSLINRFVYPIRSLQF